MKKIPAEPMQRIAGKPMKRVRRVPLFVPTTDENGNEAFKKNPVLMQKEVITEEKKTELVTMLYNFNSEVIATANVVTDVTKKLATYEARKQLLDTLRELSETCRAFAHILDAEIAAIQNNK